ncbi:MULTISPECIES: hypothetical protein [unclassified Streptomyces]|uniref:hypothetical protein n=1 Tax=unclassified Streptomyces TaxID=2593676 RepID=UPI00225B4D9B|nr:MULTISPECIES: hypothetical protein [unclassified Streptomyces]MCX5055296.1 hypothetical protein [Streptomyces sp. NBC_00474]MCX5062357.1 hypothetical protein [Streptomyces sp. NBC_00452]MCX5249983.1 hypothetical protein [Streptomyces sp. NBC_00201]MCX5292035.1 hypothetical protein [Streptomyces sp. NBC_00183]
MSTLIMPAPARRAHATSQDHRIALLTARAGLEPELAARYLADPVSVLAEFGVVAAEPVYLAAAVGETFVLEDLDRPDTSISYDSWFTGQEHSAAGSGTPAA